ncbi:MAG: SpoIID/LytB domain-containing protein [Clostridia bacterium]
MKKNIRRITIVVVLIVALTFAMPVFAAAFHTDIRVLLSVGSASSITFTVSGDYYVAQYPDFSVSSGKATVFIKGNRPVLACDGKEITSSAITLINRDYAKTSSHIVIDNDKYGKCAYLGNVTFDASDGAVRVINTLPIEQYLYGVVPYEMSNTFPLEALKAQAVCARGYAVSNCSAYGPRAYDIGDTSSDQVYHGYVSKYTRAISAVDETHGQVLTYDGDIIQAYYSASNGGQTELTGNVWKSNLPYYVHRDDIYDLQNASSLEERSFIPATFTYETMGLMDRPVLSALQSGANIAAGEAVKLLSVVRIKAHTSKFDAPSRIYTKADIVLNVANSANHEGQLTFTIDLNNFVKTDANPSGIFNSQGRTLRMRGAEQGILSVDNIQYPGWFLTNRRYGHGVGLSQRGAQQRATGGQPYADMLDFYYADTQLCSIGTYADAPTLTSSTYIISESGVSGISPGTSPSELIGRLKTAGERIYLVSSHGAQKTDGLVSTGSYVRTVYGDGSSYFDLPVILYGDINGDGQITTDDMDALMQHLLNARRLTGAYLLAADINHDGTVDAIDALRLQKHLQHVLIIEQHGGITE